SSLPPLTDAPEAPLPCPRGFFFLRLSPTFSDFLRLSPTSSDSAVRLVEVLLHNARLALLLSGVALRPLPLQEFAEQPLALLLSQISVRRPGVSQEGRKLAARRFRHIIGPQTLEHLVRRRPARPARNGCR